MIGDFFSISHRSISCFWSPCVWQCCCNHCRQIAIYAAASHTFSSPLEAPHPPSMIIHLGAALSPFKERGIQCGQPLMTPFDLEHCPFLFPPLSITWHQLDAHLNATSWHDNVSSKVTITMDGLLDNRTDTLDHGRTFEWPAVLVWNAYV